MAETSVSPSKTNHLLRWIMVTGGMIVVLLAAFSLYRDARVYYSPLDEVDVAALQDDQGFVPIYAAEVPSSGLESAPTLDQGAAPDISQMPTSTPLAATPTPDGQPTRRMSAILPFPTQTATPQPIYIPDRIFIPAIGLDAPIIPVSKREIEAQGQQFEQWIAPKRAVGWHNTSATLGVIGNTVLNGHHNTDGEVFRDVNTLIEGDQILVYSGEQVFVYQVGLSLRLNERFRPVEERLRNAQWILPSQDERLTLITCWPYESNTHRVVVVALPVETSDTRH